MSNKEECIVKYMKFKKIQNSGYCKYAVFRRIIMYILDVHDNNYFIRKTFLKLVEKNYFYKIINKDGKCSYRYKFNPDRFIPIQERSKKKVFPIVISFD